MGPLEKSEKTLAINKLIKKEIIKKIETKKFYIKPIQKGL
jgi:hypothetical protein